MTTLEKMTRAQLVTHAKEIGVDVTGLTTKAELREAITAHESKLKENPPAVDDSRITVRGEGQEGRVAFWEEHDDHPGGELILHGGSATRVAETPGVRWALENGRLSRVQEGSS